MVYFLYGESAKDFFQDLQAKGLLQNIDRSMPIASIDFDAVTAKDRIVLSGSLREIKKAILMCADKKIGVGIVPMSDQKELAYTFDLPRDPKKAFALALSPSDKPIDLLVCNDTAVIQEAVIAQAPLLERFCEIELSVFRRLKSFFASLKSLKRLRHTSMRLQSANGSDIKLSALGIVALKYRNRTFASRLFNEPIGARDHKATLIILSPGSIISYVKYLFSASVAFLRPKKLPGSVGFMRSSHIAIKSDRIVRVSIDGEDTFTQNVDLKIRGSALYLSVGERFWQRHSDEKEDSKERIKIDHLPTDEERIAYLSKGVPLFDHASQAQYAQLFSQLREEARFSVSFAILLVLSSLIATLGLLIDSASVIIGAMLLAPLMQPIVSVSMGVLRQDVSLLTAGSKSIALGVVLVLASASLVALTIPFEYLSSEMNARLFPTLLDLFVAIVSGSAAAYAKSNEKIASSLAGVAIAVALVPPLATAGIGLGWGSLDQFLSALLLFVTNLVGIVLSAALTFMVLGFAPIRVAKKGLLLWLLPVVATAIPLYSAFATMQEDLTVKRRFESTLLSIGEVKVKIQNVRIIHASSGDEIHFELLVPHKLTNEQIQTLKSDITKRLNKPARLVVTYRYVL